MHIQEILAKQMARRYANLAQDQLDQLEKLLVAMQQLLEERDKALTVLAKLITGDYDQSLFEQPVFPVGWLENFRDELASKDNKSSCTSGEI